MTNKNCQVDVFDDKICVTCICVYYGFGGQYTPPMIKLPRNATPEVIGSTVLEVLKEANGWLPEEDRVDRQQEFLEFVGVRSFREFIRTVRSMSVFVDGDMIKVNPCVAVGSSLDHREGKRCSPDPKAIGETVLELQAKCQG